MAWYGNTFDNIVEHKIPALQDSKLICELLLKQALDRGIPCKVYRLPWIAGKSQTGWLNPIDNLYILRYLSFVKVKAMPPLAIPATPIPVDICARISLQLFFDDEAPCEVYNIAHPQPPIEQELVGVAKEEFGVDIEILEQDNFLDKMKDTTLQDGASDLSGRIEVEHELFLSLYRMLPLSRKGFGHHHIPFSKLKSCESIYLTMKVKFLPV